MKNFSLQILLLAIVLTANRGRATSFFYTVTGTTDNTDSATHGGSGTAGSPFQMSSLRGATIAANANPGSTIILPAGTYSLTIAGDANDRNFVSFDATKGDLDISGSGTTIQGAGPSLTTIQQTTGADRILTDNPNSVIGFTFAMTGIKLTGGRDATTFEGGGAIFVGGQNNITTISNCAFVNNQMTGGAGNGGGAICNTGGNLNVLNCTFGGTGASDPNVSTVSGGAIAYNSSDFVNSGGSGVATISGCTFMTNSATSTSSGGGALVVSQSNLSTATAVVTNCVFKGNKNSNGNGGAISIESGTLTVVACTFDSNQAQGNGHGGVARSTGGTVNTFTYCRFINNTAATPANGNVLAFGASGGSFTANNNWWGQNTGPAANAIDASAGSAAITVANWLQLRHTANPNTITVPNSTTLTATFLLNSLGTAIPAANLGALVGVPIAFNNAVNGTLSGAQATVPASGTATATFTATAGGAGGADAVVDGQTVTAPITVNVLPSITCPADITTNAAGYCVPSIAFASTVTAGFPAPAVSYKLGATAIASPYAFPIGTNVVTSTATNIVGTNSCNFTVKVFAGAAPQLSILRNKTNVIVSWSNSFPCYTLQSAPVLASNSWSTYPGPFATNGGKVFVTNSTPFTNRFFRLSF